MLPWASLFAVVLAAGVPQATVVAPGTMVERVASSSDSTQTYALYLPSAYNPSRRWPLLFVFDPRGRGALAAALFRDAAETHGWVIVSSNNTRSDGPWDPNGRALAALWPSVLEAYSADPRRIYAAGFSGGGGVAWVLAQSTGALAGVIASGAPAGKEIAPPAGRLAWFGSAGRGDFNFLDARTLGDRMAAAGLSHRLEFFDGPHQWMTPDLARLAVGWLEVLAMKNGLRPRDEALAAKLLAEEMTRADQLESSGRLVDARRTLGAIVETYTGLADVTGAARRIRELDANDQLARARKDERRGDEWESAQRAAATLAVAGLRAEDPPYVRELLERLNVASLQRRARRTDYDGEAARRVLELIFVQTAFYMPRAFADRREFGRAATSLEVATAIHPDRPNVWFNLAGARAMASARKEAIAALKKAIELGFDDRDALATDERFKSLRGTAEYQRLVQLLGGK